MRPVLAPVLAVALAAMPLPAAACSVAPGYRVPTNRELVADADLILLAAISDGDAEPGHATGRHILLMPVAALKGTMPAEPIALPAAIATAATPELSNPYELQEAHPQSLSGACYRYAFPRGSRMLFFLDKHGGAWRQAGGPFSRWAEDVLTDDAPWLRLVRFYLEVQALPESEQAAALAARRAEWAGRTDNPVAQLLAADVGRQLAGPNPPLRKDQPPAPPGDGKR